MLKLWWYFFVLSVKLMNCTINHYGQDITWAYLGSSKEIAWLAGSFPKVGWPVAEPGPWLYTDTNWNILKEFVIFQYNSTMNNKHSIQCSRSSSFVDFHIIHGFIGPRNSILWIIYFRQLIFSSTNIWTD